MLITVPMTPTLAPVLSLLADEAEAWTKNLVPGAQQEAWTNLTAALRAATAEALSFSFEAHFTPRPKQENGVLSNDRLEAMCRQADSRGSAPTRRAWGEIAIGIEDVIIRGRIEEDVPFLANMISRTMNGAFSSAALLAEDPEALAAAKVLGRRIHEWEKSK